MMIPAKRENKRSCDTVLVVEPDVQDISADLQKRRIGTNVRDWFKSTVGGCGLKPMRYHLKEINDGVL